MEATAAGYPEGVIELLDKNPATVSYVEDYGKNRDRYMRKILEMTMWMGRSRF